MRKGQQYALFFWILAVLVALHQQIFYGYLFKIEDLTDTWQTGKIHHETVILALASLGAVAWTL